MVPVLPTPDKVYSPGVAVAVSVPEAVLEAFIEMDTGNPAEEVAEMVRVFVPVNVFSAAVVGIFSVNT